MTWLRSAELGHGDIRFGAPWGNRLATAVEPIGQVIDDVPGGRQPPEADECRQMYTQFHDLGFVEVLTEPVEHGVVNSEVVSGQQVGVVQRRLLRIGQIRGLLGSFKGALAERSAMQLRHWLW